MAREWKSSANCPSSPLLTTISFANSPGSHYHLSLNFLIAVWHKTAAEKMKGGLEGQVSNQFQERRVFLDLFKHNNYLEGASWTHTDIYTSEIILIALKLSQFPSQSLSIRLQPLLANMNKLKISIFRIECRPINLRLKRPPISGANFRQTWLLFVEASWPRNCPLEVHFLLAWSSTRHPKLATP